MTDEVAEVASPVVQEPVDSPVPEVSGPVEQPSSAPSGLTEERLQEILEGRFKDLADQLARANQSVKDRRIGKLETSVEKLLAVKGLVDQKGGDWEAAISETRESEISERMANLESKLLQPPAGQVSPDWKQEWQDESKKIVDAAAKLGIALTDDEYNAALFGKKFASKGDAFAALQGALILKTRGESVTPAALANEGGTLPAQPEKLSFRQTLEKAETIADKTKILNARWDEIGKELKKQEVRDALVEKGLTVEDLR